MYRPRATKNEMTFERADRMEANKSKRLIEFFAACQERLFYYVSICNERFGSTIESRG